MAVVLAKRRQHAGTEVQSNRLLSRRFRARVARIRRRNRGVQDRINLNNDRRRRRRHAVAAVGIRRRRGHADRARVHITVRRRREGHRQGDALRAVRRGVAAAHHVAVRVRHHRPGRQTAKVDRRQFVANPRARRRRHRHVAAAVFGNHQRARRHPYRRIGIALRYRHRVVGATRGVVVARHFARIHRRVVEAPAHRARHLTIKPGRHRHLQRVDRRRQFGRRATTQDATAQRHRTRVAVSQRQGAGTRRHRDAAHLVAVALAVVLAKRRQHAGTEVQSNRLLSRRFRRRHIAVIDLYRRIQYRIHQHTRRGRQAVCSQGKVDDVARTGYRRDLTIDIRIGRRCHHQHDGVSLARSRQLEGAGIGIAVQGRRPTVGQGHRQPGQFIRGIPGVRGDRHGDGRIFLGDVVLIANRDIDGRRQHLIQSRRQLSLDDRRRAGRIDREFVRCARHGFDNAHQVDKGMSAVRRITRGQTGRRRFFLKKRFEISASSNFLNDLCCLGRTEFADRPRRRIRSRRGNLLVDGDDLLIGNEETGTAIQEADLCRSTGSGNDHIAFEDRITGLDTAHFAFRVARKDLTLRRTDDTDLLCVRCHDDPFLRRW